ncbi:MULTISPECIES: hypothetical protein [Providencia]|uniref:Uncharacterized protein n=1 Tax=Providencia huaxiensis TaxID=2027290 RepID=A0ABU2J1L7_9GAMM|nr:MULTISPECIES: hypothetical protein [Providencia]MDI7238713.1 hypothetical protein [Providencia huaxiensis]MDT0134909.1 hypothetical protein [Providencia huaxiensis]MDT1981314.1 hypothetical protein [Providencia huaxiensis]UPQ37718.1 hypothetical protein LV777_10220 [Providencia rettgeri]
MATQITVNIEEMETGVMNYEIIGSHTGAGATENEIEVAKRLSLGIRNALQLIKPTNKEQSNAH